MNLEEFEQGYAERSKLTVERLHELGLRGAPCDCEDELCQGWQMIHEPPNNSLERTPVGTTSRS